MDPRGDQKERRLRLPKRSKFRPPEMADWPGMNDRTTWFGRVGEGDAACFLWRTRLGSPRPDARCGRRRFAHLHAALGEAEPLLDHGGQLSDPTALLSQNVLGPANAKNKKSPVELQKAAVTSWLNRLHQMPPFGQSGQLSNLLLSQPIINLHFNINTTTIRNPKIIWSRILHDLVSQVVKRQQETRLIWTVVENQSGQAWMR